MCYTGLAVKISEWRVVKDLEGSVRDRFEGRVTNVGVGTEVKQENLMPIAAVSVT
jgi:hypothetical protein